MFSRLLDWGWGWRNDSPSNQITWASVRTSVWLIWLTHILCFRYALPPYNGQGGVSENVGIAAARFRVSPAHDV
jgi:hypothetical protein